MVCSKGDGGCLGFVTFSPPVILAGTLPKPTNNLHLNLKVVTFLCKAKCGGAQAGKFQIKVFVDQEGAQAGAVAGERA